MYYYVYRISNKLNGKFYIGCHQTSNLNDNYMGSGKKLLLSIAKHGISNFEKEILKFFPSREEMLEYEKTLVTSELLANKLCYNLKVGGEGGFDYLNRTGLNKTGVKKRNYKEIAEKVKKTKSSRTYIVSEEIRKKISIANKNRNPEINKRVSNALTGRKLTEDHKKKISQSLKRHILNNNAKKEYVERMIKVREKRPSIIQESTKQKISESLKNVWASGKRKKTNHDWASIQNDWNLGMKRKDIYVKYKITKNIFLYGIVLGKLKRI